MATSKIQNVQVVVTCPACGSPDYDFEFDQKDIEDGVTISYHCEDCDKLIEVGVAVFLQSREGSGD